LDFPAKELSKGISFGIKTSSIYHFCITLARANSKKLTLFSLEWNPKFIDLWCNQHLEVSAAGLSKQHYLTLPHL
jgi:hypothetical protein